VRRVDLRSDTVTRPTAQMRAAMAAAEVGDDGFGDDPTVARLEARYCEMVDKEAAVFVPSGVMANQVALRVLTRPGDAVVAGRDQHVVGFELGAAARNAQVQFHTVDDSSGELDPAEVAAAVESEHHHRPAVTLVCVENTHMASGGMPWSLERLDAVVAAAQGRPVHLDGARLFNASVATGISPAQYARRATTVMTCISKGLAAPIGSLLAGTEEFVAQARVERKRLGGTMRKVGIVAAAGLIALDSMVERLAEDHARARRLAEALAEAFPGAGIDPARCVTNIVVADLPDATAVAAGLTEAGVLADTISATRLRLVTHLDVDDEDVEYARSAIARVARA
jgi:threonine aldolase